MQNILMSSMVFVLFALISVGVAHAEKEKKEGSLIDPPLRL